jgi:hypothetical protein
MFVIFPGVQQMDLILLVADLLLQDLVPQVDRRCNASRLPALSLDVSDERGSWPDGYAEARVRDSLLCLPTDEDTTLTVFAHFDCRCPLA